MTTAIQFLRSPIASLRPVPGTLDDGMPYICTNAGTPGLFFRLEGGQELTKIGPAQVGPQAPNAQAPGFAGNARGEFWYDTTVNTLKIWDGTAWRSTDTTLQITDLLGVDQDDANLGTFSGTTIADNVTIKAALQALETKVEAVDSTLALVDLDTNDFAQLVGLAENVTNLGTFSGSTIADGESVKDALQQLETAVESKLDASAVPTVASLHLDDVRTALGLASGVASFGTFSGTTLQDNDTLPDLLQALETAVEARASLGSANVFQGEHTLRDKLSIDPDGNLHLELKRNTVTQCDILLRNPPSGATLNINTVNSHADDSLTFYSTKSWFRAHGGGTGNVQVDGTLTVGSTDVGATLALKAPINDAVFTGVTKAAQLEVDNDGVGSGFYYRFNRNGNTQFDILGRNIPSGGVLNINCSNGNNGQVQIHSELFWCRDLTGNGTAKFDGNVEMGSELRLSNDYADKAAAGTGALGDIAVIGGSLCFHDGTDWKTVTLGSAPS